MGPGSAAPAETVVAVIVTRDRVEQLGESLAAVAAQHRRPDHVVVVDNGPDPRVGEVVAGCGLPATYLPSRRNLGGAGGFALGMLHALALGADWVWCADDDGRPADGTVLGTLLETACRHGLAQVSPMVADLSDPDRLAFPLRRGLTWRRRRSDFAGLEVLPRYASLFNGALFRADALDVVGVPDYRLFFRGDETEIHRRLLRAGLPFGTAVGAAYLHPEGTSEFEPILGGRLSAQYPGNEVKRYFTYRNRGYLMSQPGMRWLWPLELVRFSWFFLVSRRDPAGWREWLRLVRAGRGERFTRP
ncbi:glycosyltransferase family 2 protein [Blastococcus sp. MG754426]|uniref:galactofuranosyltransferase GlfT1 n=1 Tax=unclassified Blastococcus TaxID=2619396 RepID=UPI001EEFA320|nr:MULTISPECIES: glycosyltransferase family 2 protein [unclassified Blastococcus]MCF6507204.1 glycosyltransferase family 2 protein [Blastococcus sp. MG754426]MCF6513930.1 glycosyltransferase family 2 protein [Blastococcus sp. MG754427]MCF6735439.1 glycosyltransferase family 2 protein [Blastococcus sp. KM273129]